MKRLPIILSIIFTGLLFKTASAQTDQAVKHGVYTTAINFPATGCNYTWTNDAPTIGLPAKGTGNIAPFLAQNDGEHAVTANITANASGGCAIIKLKIVVDPAIPVVKATGGPVTVNTVYGDASQAAKFMVSGDNLRSGIVIKAPAGFQVSTDGVAFSESASLNSDNAKLSYINLNPDMIRTTATGPGDYNYTSNVDNSVNSVTVSPIASATLSTIKVNGVNVNSGAISSPIALTPGNNAVEILVTAQNGVSTKKYILNIVRAGSSDATLSNITVDQGSLTPTFSGANTNYTTIVYTNALKVTPFATNADAKVKVNGAELNSGTPSPEIPLTPGLNNVAITVTAQDGVTTKTYNLDVISTKSSNAGLASLNLTPASTLTRITGTTNYVTVTEATETSVRLTAVASDANATIKANGITIASGVLSPSIPLNNTGSTMVKIVITAQDGTTTQTYTINISKTYPTNTTLASTNYEPQLYLTYQPNTNNTNSSVNKNVTSIKISATPGDDKASVKINGLNVANSTLSDPIPLNASGPTVIPITVIARDGVSTRTNTITIKKDGSTNALLKSVALDIPASLSIVLGTSNFTTSVSPQVTSVRQLAVTSDEHATMTVNGYKVASGILSPPINLSSTGPTNIVTTVTAEDGIHTFTYIVIVRKNGSTNTSILSVATDPSAALIAVPLSDINYNTSVASNVTSIRQRISTVDPNTTIKVNGKIILNGALSDPIPLNETGPTDIRTIITAQDGVSTKTVILTVRKNGSTNTRIKEISFSPASFATAVTGATYLTSVLPSVNSVQQTIVPEDPNAKITVNGVAVLPGVPSDPILLNATGTTIITNKITAPDGVSTKTYTVTVSKNGSTVASIDQLYLSPSAVLVPVAGTDNFTASIGAGTTSVKQIVIPDEEHAHVFINNTAVASGTASGAITLNATGKTVITIKVVAQDGVTTKISTVTITRGSNGELLTPLNTTLAPTPVFIRLSATTAAGIYNSKTIISSTDAADGNLQLEKCIVRPAPLAIVTVNVTKRYGQQLKDQPQSEKFSITAGTLKNGNTIKSVAIGYTPAGPATATAGLYSGSAVPSSAIGENGFLSTNYDITYQAADVVVKPVKLFVKADDITKEFGVANPPLTVTYSGFVNNDGPDQLTIKPTISTTAVTRSVIGQYPITVAGAQSPNYLFIYQPGVLTVSAEHLLIFVPNTITPNGDGVNDTWNIKNIDAYPNTTVEVFNRQGQKVFNSLGYGTPWDGSYKGVPLPSGTYYYFVKNDARVLSGSITLIL